MIFFLSFSDVVLCKRLLWWAQVRVKVSFAVPSAACRVVCWNQCPLGGVHRPSCVRVSLPYPFHAELVVTPVDFSLAWLSYSCRFHSSYRIHTYLSFPPLLSCRFHSSYRSHACRIHTYSSVPCVLSVAQVLFLQTACFPLFSPSTFC